MDFLGIILALLILSIKTGLILGSALLTKKQICFIAAALGVLFIVLMKLFNPFLGQLIVIVEKYTFVVSLMLGFLLIYLGMANESTCCNDFNNGSICKMQKKRYMAAFLPCPFCLLALIISVVIYKAQTDLTGILLELVIACTYGLLIMVSAFGARWAIRYKNINPSHVFNALLIFIGIITIVLSLFIPNFVKSAQMSFSVINICQDQAMLYVLLAIIGAVLLGYFRYILSNFEN
ncbi:MAG: DUF2162 family putative transporter [Bacillota bacterium]